MPLPSELCIIGAGNVATHLARALLAAGAALRAVSSRTEASARTLGEACRVAWTTSVAALPDTPTYIICVSDDAIPLVASQLRKLHPEALIVHTAGSVALDALPVGAGATGVIYPLQTFSRKRQVDFGQVPCFVEASTPEALRTVTALAAFVSQRVHPLDSAGRMHLHLAAVFACNFANHCIALGQEQLRQAGFTGSLILPLIEETFEKLRHMPASEAQTGPAMRRDRTVTDKHLALLAGNPPLRDLYARMSDSITLLHSHD